jgi:hypothetical protein
MDLLGILHVLVRRRRLVGVGACVAAIAGLLSLYEVSLSPLGLTSRQHTAGAGVARMLVDKPRSASTSVTPLDEAISLSLPIRARMLADLTAAEPWRTAVAREAGLRPDQLFIATPALDGPPTKSPLALATAIAAATPNKPHVLRLVIDGSVPIIWIETSAPTPRGAARLADAAAHTLTTIAASRGAGQRSGIAVERLGAGRALAVPVGPRKAFGGLLALVIFAGWCGALVVASSVRRRRALVYAT